MSALPTSADDSRPAPPSYPRRLVVLLAVAVSLLFGLPHLIMWGTLHASGRPYSPVAVDHVTALTYDETTYYAPRVRDFYDGHPYTADPAGWEYKRGTEFLGVGSLPPLLLSPLLRLGHGNVGAVFALCDFLLPPLLFLLLLLLCRALGVPFWAATAGALLLLTADDQLTLPFRWLAHPQWSVLRDSLHLTASYRPVEYSRLTIPQLGYAFVVLTILGLHQTAHHPRLRTGVWTALALGALFYTYVFFWTWILAGAALYVVTLLLQRRWSSALAVVGVVATGCALGAPVLYQALFGYVGQAFLEARQTWGGKQIDFTHHKYELAVWALLLVMFPWRDRRFPLLVSFLLAPYLCVGAARLVHLNTQEWHWFGRCWAPWMGLALPVAFWARATEPCRHELCQRLRPFLRARLLGPVLGAVVVFCFAYGVNDHVRYGLSMAPSHTLTPDEQAAYAWLRGSAPRDAVVAAADCNVLALVPVHTQCNVYLPYCLISPASDEELMARFWTTVRLLDLDDRAVDRFLAPEQHTPEGFWYPHRWWMVNWLFHTRYGGLALPPAVRTHLDAVRASVARQPLAALLAQQRLDYLWVDNELEPYCRTNPADQPHLREVFSSGTIRIYELVKPTVPPAEAPSE